MPSSNPPDPQRLVGELTLQEALELGTFASQKSMDGAAASTCIGPFIPCGDDNDDD